MVSNEQQPRIIADDEALLLLKLAAQAEAAQAELNLTLKAVAAKYGILEPAIFSYSNRAIMPEPKPQPGEIIEKQ